MVEIKYNNSTIAIVEGGQVATLACNEKEMESDLEIIASQVVNSPLPIEVTTEAEMTALLEAPVIGGIYKYTGITGAYENGAIYVIEKVEEEETIYSLTITNIGNSSHEFMYYGVDTEVYDDMVFLDWNSTVTVDGIKSFVYCQCDYIFVQASTVLNNCTIEWVSSGMCKVYPTGDNASITLEVKD